MKAEEARSLQKQSRPKVRKAEKENIRKLLDLCEKGIKETAKQNHHHALIKISNDDGIHTVINILKRRGYGARWSIVLDEIAISWWSKELY